LSCANSTDEPRKSVSSMGKLLFIKGYLLVASILHELWVFNSNAKFMVYLANSRFLELTPLSDRKGEDAAFVE